MTAKLVSRTLPAAVIDPVGNAFEKIDETDLAPIGEILRRPSPDGEGWTENVVAVALEEYRRFLKLNAKYPNHRVVPSRFVDAVWHAHILDTRKYADDCSRIFGEFLHHFPYFGTRGDAAVRDQAFQESEALYLEEFGPRSVRVQEIEAACCDAGDVSMAAGCDAGDVKTAACCDAGDVKVA